MPDLYEGSCAFDAVLLPKTFSTLLLPEPLVTFFTARNIEYRSAVSFPMQALRDLHKEDKETFKTVIFLLSVYGCNFHSKKSNSFFPCDVSDAESVFIFEGSANDRFSLADMSRYGFWIFCRRSSSSKRSFLNGVVASRLAALTNADVNAMLECPGLSLSQTVLFPNDGPGSSSDSGLRSQGDSRPYGALISTGSVGADNESNPPSNTPKKPDLPKIAARIYLNDSSSNPDDYLLEVKNALVAPVFWIRFVSSFLTMSSKAKSVYESCNFNTFGDLLGIKADDIGRISHCFDDAVDDPFLRGAYLNALVCYCKHKDAFLKDFGSNHHLEDFLSWSDATKSCIAQRPDDFYVIDLDKHPLLKLPFGDCCNRYHGIDDHVRDYFALFGISNIDFIGQNLLNHSIRDYTLKGLDESLAILFTPFNLVDEVCRGAMGKAPLLPFGYDREIRALQASEYVRSYLTDIRKLPHLKANHLDILGRRERTSATLEEVAKDYGVTRERIRQIETKTAERVSQCALNLLDSLYPYDDCIPLSFTVGIVGLYSCIKRRETIYSIDEDLGIAARIEKRRIIDETKKMISGLEGKQTCESLDHFFERYGFSLYPWLAKFAYKFEYDPYPRYVISKISLAEVARGYLLSKGIRGFNIKKDEADLSAYFAEKAPQSRLSDYHALYNDVIRSGAVLRDMSVYISPRIVTEEQKQIVKDILDNTDLGPYGVTGLSLFKKHHERLISCGIDNGYFFYGVASYFYPKSYVYGGRSLRIFDSSKLSLNEMAEHYIKENGPVVKMSDFLSDLHLQVPALQQISNITSYDESTLVLKSWFEWTEAEFIALSSYIDDKIKQQGFCHGLDIIRSSIFYDESKNGFLKKNRIGNNPSKLIYFLDAMAERYEVTRYHFSHHCNCVSFPDSPVEVKADMAIKHFKGKTFTSKDATSFFEKYHMNGALDAEFFDSIAYMAAKNTFTLKEDLNIPDLFVKQASDILIKYYGDEPFILPNVGLNRLNAAGFKERFDGRPIEMASVLSASKESDWCVPKNDLGAKSSQNRFVLANKKILGPKPLYSSVIRAYVENAHRGQFVSVQELREELTEQELIDGYVDLSALRSALSPWLNGLIVEVPA